MLTVEDILAALAGRAGWLLMGADGQPRRQSAQYSGILLELEQYLAALGGDDSRIRAPGRPTAKGKQSKPAARPGSLSEHAAQCVAGMRKLDNAAIFWVVNCDKGAYERMHSRLVQVGRQLVQKDKVLPAKIARKANEMGQLRSEDYIPDLATLALYELRWPARFYSHADRAAWFGISAEHWRKLMAPGYGILIGECIVWYGSGLAHIARKLGIRPERATG